MIFKSYLIFCVFFISFFSCSDMRIRTIRDDKWQLYNQYSQQSSSYNQQRPINNQNGINNGFIIRKQYKNLMNRKKEEYYTPKDVERKRPPVKFEAPENFYFAESKSDETIYLEDIIFKDYVIKKGKKIYRGEKLFFKNKYTDQFFPQDDKKLMTPIGVCRAYLLEVKKDLEDDGILNGSVKDSICERSLGGKTCTKHNDMLLIQKSFQDLEDWHGDDFKDAMVAFLSSCTLFMTKDGCIKSHYLDVTTYAKMRPICEIATTYHAKGYDKIFFERYFSPFLIKDKNKGFNEGLFTGYYLWEIKASRYPSGKYWYPIYKKPSNNDDITRYSRKDINQGALRGKNLEMLWCDNVYDVYSLQVQGSGVAYLEDGNIIRLGYDGKNNFTFRSYSEKVKNEPEFFSNYCREYTDIIDCLKKNAQIGLYATNHNDSFVFFKEMEGEDIFGSQGVPLTQSRSIAIDPKYHPYGLPYYIETSAPLLEYHEDEKDKEKCQETWIPFNRLYMSQDTGSAIKGISRADLYLGHGFKGEYIAKNMKFPGEMYILLPNFTIDKVCG